jgi:hypothetical protein
MNNNHNDDDDNKQKHIHTQFRTQIMNIYCDILRKQIIKWLMI